MCQTWRNLFCALLEDVQQVYDNPGWYMKCSNNPDISDESVSTKKNLLLYIPQSQ